MASEALATTLPRAPALPRWFVEGVFTGVLLLIFVGLQPFKPVAFPFTTVGEATSGDAMHQAVFVALFTAQLMISLQRRSLGAFTALPTLLLLLLVWCFVSALWAAVPDVTVRRSALQFLLFATLFMAVESVEPKRAFALLGYVLIGILLLNWASIPIIPSARHMAGEDDPGLVSDWRGLYIHKNIAGAVCVVTALIVGAQWLERRRWRDLLFFVLAMGFLAGTRSKTSIGFLPAAIGFGLAYRWGWKRDLNRAIVAVGALLSFALIIILVLVKLDTFAHALNDPNGFTGRSLIWRAEFGFIADHPLFGAGYGSFADTGAKSPLTNYLLGNWIQDVSHGHNGYLEMLVTLGGIGFVVAMLGFVAVPLVQFWPRGRDEDVGFRAMLFALFSFVLMHNFLETDFLDRDGPVWAVFLMVLAALGQAREGRALA